MLTGIRDISISESVSKMPQTMPPLRIIAQPKAMYRPRYLCEGRPHRNRAQRFVRADPNPNKYIYPTVEIPIEWVRELCPPVYIRLMHVTVPNESVNVRCVHPYPIDTEDIHVIKDPETNSLFFPVSLDELESGRKNFQFTLYKLTQYELRTYGPLRLIDSGEFDEKRLEDPTEYRKIVDLYQLAQSQLVFSIAVFQNNQSLPVIFTVSSVRSQTMTASTASILCSIDDELSVRCSPQKGDAQGEEEILMVIPRVDKRKEFAVRFDHPSMKQQSTVSMVFVDTRTISFYTPPCPVPLTRENPTCTIPIVVTQNNVELARVDFVYQSMDAYRKGNGRKRSCPDEEELDLSPTQNHATTVQISPPNKISQFSQLENAIEQGDIDLAIKILKERSSYLEQVNDRGETPLLMAAKSNQNRLILEILRKQSKYAKQVDKQGNNLLHLLANVPENKAGTSIDNIFVVLDEHLREELLLARNRFEQTPDDIARKWGNMDYIDLFNRQIIFLDSN